MDIMIRPLLFLMLCLITDVSFGQILPTEQKQDSVKAEKKTKPIVRTKESSIQTSRIDNSAAVIKILPDATAVLSVDGENKGTIEANTVKKITLKLGTYKIKLSSTENNNDVYTNTYEVTKEQAGKEILFEVSLQNIIQSRLAREKATEEARQEAINRQKAADERNKKMQEFANQFEINMVPVTGDGFNFEIDKYLLTQREWQAVMGNNPSYFSGCNDCPVEQVSWTDAQKFIAKLNEMTGKHYRLPTALESEYAAKGGNQSHGYVYSASNEINEVAWYMNNSGGQTHPVGQKKANELGLYDMSGNVWEWCQDWFDDSQQSRVLRGGSWHLAAYHCQVSYRGNYEPDGRINDFGFRLAQDR